MIRVAIVFVLAFAGAVGAQTMPIGPDRAVNGGFETDAAWAFISNSGADASGATSAEQAHSGVHSYKVTNKTGFAPNVYARAVQVVTGLEPFTTYRISCWVKGKKSGICWIGGGPGWFNRNAFP
jgi:hypothetical protein